MVYTMVKKKFTECKTEVVVFDTHDVISTSSFDGAIDELSGESRNAAIPAANSK